MNKLISSLLLVLLFSSCNFFKTTDKDATKNDTLKDLVIGGDKDDDGCLVAAGYIWSQLKNECVRAFSGIQLTPLENPQEDALLCAYLLFDESNDKAELFLPNQDKSIVLERESEGKSWVYKNYELIPWKGYVLKKDNKPIFSGDAEIGSNITGSDDKEELLNNSEQ